MRNSRILSLISAIVAALVVIGGMMMLTGMFLAPPTPDLRWGFALGVIISGFGALGITNTTLALFAAAIVFNWASQSGLYEASNDFMSGFVVASILGLILTFAQDALEKPEEEAE